MRALVWHGKGDVRCDTVPDPVIEHPRDIIVKITSTAICGSDLHLYDHYMPAMEKGDILGHEPMGQVVEVGSAITKFEKGDRVVVPFTICCGECFFARRSSGPVATAPIATRKRQKRLWDTLQLASTAIRILRDI